MPDEQADFFRCEETSEGWSFQVCVVRWDHPSTPSSEWIPFRKWKTAPDPQRLEKARNAALSRPRFFRTCSMCHELNNAGHMHDLKICQSCAEQHLGVCY
ncbi:MAG: hypothetical protein ABJQ29_15585 [Luteolibacter sp.]